MHNILLALVTARLTFLFVEETGPFDLLAKFRDRLGINYDENGEIITSNVLAGAFSCVWCLSVWIGVIVALVGGYPWWHGLAYSMITIVIDKYVD